MIVDDEPLACRKIIRMLEKHPEIKVLGEVHSGKQAIQEIELQHPDLLFLDIQMPDLSGFQVLESLSLQKMPIIIFVTAYDEYALEAFNFAAMDYLLKPFSSARFETALERAKSQFHLRDPRQEVQTILYDVQLPQLIDRIMVRSGDRIHFLPAQRIQWIEAHGRYSYLHVGKEAYLLRQSLSTLEDRLDPKIFLRINRKSIVNLDCVSELQIIFNGQYMALLNTGLSLRLSRRYLPKIRQRLGVLQLQQ